jgi:gas vesicle protein
VVPVRGTILYYSLAKNNHNMKLTRLLAFAAIGTGVALLFTTKRGKALRSDIMDKSSDFLSRLNKLRTDTTEDLKEVGNKATKAAKQYV